jgi:hypothetical protein
MQERADALAVSAGSTSAQLVVPGRFGPCLNLPSDLSASSLTLFSEKSEMSPKPVESTDIDRREGVT